MKKKETRNLLLQVEMERRRILRPRFLEMGLTVGQGQPRILKALLEFGPMSQRELSDICFLDATTMSRTLDRLSQAGLLERTRKEDSRRSYQIRLTEKGKDKACLVEEAFRQVDDIIWDGFTEEEMEDLQKGLGKIRDNMKQFRERPLSGEGV